MKVMVDSNILIFSTIAEMPEYPFDPKEIAGID